MKLGLHTLNTNALSNQCSVVKNQIDNQVGIIRKTTYVMELLRAEKLVILVDSEISV